MGEKPVMEDVFPDSIEMPFDTQHSESRLDCVKSLLPAQHGIWLVERTGRGGGRVTQECRLIDDFSATGRGCGQDKWRTGILRTSNIKVQGYPMEGERF